MAEFGPNLGEVEGGKVTEELRGSFKPSPPPIQSEESIKAQVAEDLPELEKAFRTIERHIEQSHPFTNRELDVAAKLILGKLTKEEQAWVIEIAERIHRRPLWHCFAGWFRFAHENGMANAPVFDGNWDTRTTIGPNRTICPVCTNPFEPKVYGQKLCSNACGAVLDKKLIEERLSQRPESKVEVAT